MTKRTHLDLFSGIGGFALACRWAGVETIGFAEIDDYASRVLAKNFPGVPNYGDVRNVPDIAATWLVTGGFPCQPFSIAGKRDGAADDRWLWPEMAGVIERIRPNWVLAENVPGIIRMELDTVLSDLECLDYSTTAVSVPAVGVDAPHIRNRIWIVAHHDNPRCAQQRRTGPASPEYATTECSSDEWEAEFWEPESGMDRVVDGIPNRVDRLRGLGNAIVPQVAYQLIQLMIAVEE